MGEGHSDWLTSCSVFFQVGQLVLTGGGHSDWLSGCSFHPDGTKLATTSGDTVVSSCSQSKPNITSLLEICAPLCDPDLVLWLTRTVLPAGPALGFLSWLLCVDAVWTQPAHLGLLLPLMRPLFGFLLCRQNREALGPEQPALPLHTASPHRLRQQCLLPALLQPPPHLLG